MVSKEQQFLKARGLQGDFRRFRKYSNNRLYRFKYDNMGQTARGFLVKRKGQTYILNENFKVIGRSKRSIPSVKKNLPKIKKELRIEFMNGKVKTVTNIPKRRKLGKAGVTITVRKGRRRMTVSGGSPGLYDLSKPSSRQRAVDEAERGAWSQLPFSPDEVLNIDVEFTYWS